MTTTFAALLFAHVLADFVFQTSRMVETKARPSTLLLHVLIVVVTAYAALGRVDTWVPLAIGAAHLVIDAIKARVPQTLMAFLLDQAAHVATLIAVVVLAPDLYSEGVWSSEAATVMAFVAGALIATRAGGFAIAHLMARFGELNLPRGLPEGGLWIGILERAIIFLFVLVGEPAGIGFLIAAKSVLRFETVSEDSRAAEYVIIGTLASFGWAMAAAWATLALVATLPPLGFLQPSP